MKHARARLVRLSEIELSLETQILIAPDLQSLRQRLRELAELADAAGQHLPSEVRPFTQSYVTDNDFQAFVSGATDALPSRMTEDWVVGTPDQVEARLRDYIAEGISHFMLWFMDAPNNAGLDLFAQTVAPRFRKS